MFSVITIVGVLLPVLFRINWQYHPGFWPCLLFWVVSLDLVSLWAMAIPDRPRKLATCMILLGMTGNATATLSNGGHMPSANWIGAMSGTIWVPITEQTRFVWLCDVYPVGFSIGDLTMLTGALLTVVLTATVSRRTGIRAA